MMKRFLLDIGLFFVVTLIFFGAMEFVAESIPNSYTYKRSYMEHHASEIQTLILGSSNAYDGLNPSEIQGAFNLANSSQTLEDDYQLLAKYIDSLDSLQTVIVGLGYHSLGATSEAYRRTYYTIYMNLYPRWPISKYSLEICNPELLTKKIIKYVVSKDVVRCDSLGQRLGHTMAAIADGKEFWNKDAETLVANDKFDIQRSSNVIENNVNYLNAIAELCSVHSVRLVIVNMSVTEEYKKHLPSEQLALQETVLQNMATSAIVIDASDWTVPPDGWYNATHLTKEASVEFTRRIGDYIRQSCP